MDNAKRYRLNEGKVAAKVIDGEAIVINAATGRYYSLDEAACVAWVHLAAGMGVAEAADEVTGRYEVDSDTALADVGSLAEQLVAEELLIESSTTGRGSLDVSGLPEASEPPRPYVAPELVTFRDMEDLLAFDPPLPVAAPHEWEWRPE